ncbi:hypothetical protein M422DRAFT_242966 [Sphaerobolus stellatus SS14]|nr:hypothetical protein M422DRAFT_242966 [Sphaerobolus stellatus SS14]
MQCLDNIHTFSTGTPPTTPYRYIPSKSDLDLLGGLISANLSPATNYNILRAPEPPPRHGVHAPEQRGYPQLRILSQTISVKALWISTKPPWIYAKHAGYLQITLDIHKALRISAKATWISAKHAGHPQGT